MASIEQLQAALNKVEGATPQEVIDAFLPKRKEIAGRSLVPLTMGHSLILAHCGQPLAKGNLEGWEPHETALALFAFTRDSEALKQEVEQGTLEDSLAEFAQGLPLGQILTYTALLMAHYLQSISTGMEMHDPNSKAAQKKTPSVGFYQRLRVFVANIIGVRST